jgi:hypothetical protein
MPFPISAYSVFGGLETTSFSILFATSIIATIMIYIGAIIEVKKLLHQKLTDALFAPIGSLVVVLGFLSGLLQAKSSTVSWRGRKYHMKDHVQNSLSV